MFETDGKFNYEIEWKIQAKAKGLKKRTGKKRLNELVSWIESGWSNVTWNWIQKSDDL